ncbi:PD-(D/E)XK nuclease family protein [Pelobium manganitolerans]|uniref:PD-(D/E)XK nuclease family protein n=1 Tax=Pelobium manganitolerans TaxID=1842495 RepID=UPI003FA3498D
MNELEEMLKGINELKTEYDKEREKNRFNVFTAMYRDNEEVKLHSRFISYLLCSKSGHGMGNKFFRLFLEEVLLLTDAQFNMESYQVIPNESNKTEYKEIDILVTDEERAIIIENKIDAKASNHIWKIEKNTETDRRYIGQLDRYYHTIITGIDKDGKWGIKRNTVYVYYLNKNGQQSSDLDESIKILQGKPENWKGIISYGNEIRQWLDKCVKEVPLEKSSLKEFIQQYLNLINKMTHNDISPNEINELKEQIASNLKSAQHLIDNFKHVKEYTVVDFWKRLKEELAKNFKIHKYYSDKHSDFHKTIEEVTNNNKDINHGILFDYEEGKMAFISGWRKLSWGIVNKGWFDFSNKDLQEIRFSDFSTENTYRLIDSKNMEIAIKNIINEILEKQKDNFANINLY